MKHLQQITTEITDFNRLPIFCKGSKVDRINVFCVPVYYIHK